MLIAQACHLFGLEALVERPLDVDDAQLAGQRMKDVGIAVAIIHAGGDVLIHLIEVAAHEDEQAAVVRLPSLLAAFAESA